MPLNKNRRRLGCKSDAPYGQTNSLIKTIKGWPFVWGLVVASVAIIWPFLAAAPEVIYIGGFGLCCAGFIAAHKIWGASKFWLIIPILSCVAVLVGCWALVSMVANAAEIRISPGSDAMPEFPDGIVAADFPEDSIYFFAGGGVCSLSRDGVIDIVKYGDRSLLKLESTEGCAVLSGQFFGRNGDVVAVLEKNVLILNRDNVLSLKTDKHRLVIYDKQYNEVVNLQFINPRAFKFTGRLQLQDNRVIEITENEYRLGTLRMKLSSLDSSACIVIRPVISN